MSEHVKSAPEWPVMALRALVGIEAVAMVGVAVMLVYDVLTQPALSVATSIALVVLAIIAAVFLGAIFVAIGKGQTWTRGAAIVWQVLQTAAAVVILQGDMAQVIGWALAIVSLAVLVLVFHPAVTERLRRR